MTVEFLSSNISTPKHTVIVDDDIYRIIKDNNWYATKNGYIVRRKRISKDKIQNIRLHRLVMGVLDNPDIIVDHINHNRADNRICNLRLCTVQENNRNSSKSTIRKKTSKYKGVSFDKAPSHTKNPWRAQYTMDGRKIHIGCFPTEIEAALAYNKAVIEHYGEFTNPNVI